MHYRYLRVFQVEGVILPSEPGERMLQPDPTAGERIVLTSTVDDYCSIVDRGRAIGIGMLKAFVGKHDGAAFEGDLQEEVARIQKRREDRFDSGPFLVFEFSGQTSANLSNPSVSLDEFRVVFDAVDKETLRAQHESRIHTVLVSLALVVGRGFRANAVTSGVYLVEGEHVVHSLSSSDSVKVVESSPLDETSVNQMAEYMHLIAQSPDLGRVYRLLTQAITETEDKLRAFLSSWAALEVFINKLFKIYEDTFIERHTSDTTLAETFFNRIRDVMKSKYRMVDKFIAISSMLETDSLEAQRDLGNLVSAKDVRDDFIHGAHIDENDLPTQVVLSLLQKYLRLHLDVIRE